MPEHMVTCFECSNRKKNGTCAAYKEVSNSMPLGGVSKKWIPPMNDFRYCDHYIHMKPVIHLVNYDHEHHYRHMGIEFSAGIDSCFYRKDIEKATVFLEWLRKCYANRSSDQRIEIERVINEISKGNSIVLLYDDKYNFHIDALKDAIEKIYKSRVNR